MKREDAKIGMEVFASNCFGCTYLITKLNKVTAWVEHRIGEVTTVGGKKIPLVFTYKNVRISKLTKA